MFEPQTSEVDSDIYFGSREVHRLASTTMLYPLEPRHFGTGMRESLASYFMRVAFAHRVAPSRLLRELVVPRIPAMQVDWITKNLINHFRHDPWLFANARVTSEIASTLGHMTGQIDLAACTFARLQGVTRITGGCAKEDRYCPKCVEQFDVLDQYSPMLWTIRQITACPVHGIKLHSPNCCVVKNTHNRTTTNIVLPGICTLCGRPKFCTDKATVQHATDAELWIARQLSSVVEKFRSGQQHFSKGSLTLGLKEAAIVLARGKHCRAARDWGINKGTMSMWINGHSVPSLNLLLRYCYLSGLSLQHMLSGELKQVPAPNEAWPLESNRHTLHALNAGALERKLKRAHEKSKCGSITMVCKIAGIDRKTANSHCPDLVAQIRRTRKKSVKKARLRKNRKQKELFNETVRSLEANGMAVTLRNVEKALRCHLPPRTSMRRLLEDWRKST